MCEVKVVYKALYGEAVAIQQYIDWIIYSKKIFGMSAETNRMRPICLLGYQDGVEI